MTESIIIISLILLNGLFVAGEFAIVVAPRASFEQKSQDGSKVAAQVLKILKDPILQDKFIATCQIGITAASLGLGMYGEHVLAHWLSGKLGAISILDLAVLHTLSSVISVLILTYLHVVLGEMIPKSLALQKAGATMLFLTQPILMMMSSLGPLIGALNSCSNFLLKRLTGIDRAKSAISFFSSEELQLIVKESEVEGIISNEISDVIEQVFEYEDLTVRDVMVPRIQMLALPSELEPDNLREILKSKAHSRYPIYGKDKDDILGAAHIKDIALVLDKIDCEDTPVKLSYRPVPFIPQLASLDTALEAMHAQKMQLAIILDDFGGTAGMITMQDIFEEVIGEIDESLTTAHLEILADGALKARGNVRINEISDALELNLPESNISTIGGIVLNELERPPLVGDKIEFGNLVIEVSELQGKGVGSCIIRQSEKLSD